MSTTDAFRLAFMGVGSGGPVRECQCGKTYYAGDFEHFDDGELEALRADENAIDLGGWAVSSVVILGREWVRDCPCDYAARVEELLWEHRSEIARFIRLRAADELAQATKDARLFDDETEPKGAES